MHEVGLQTHGHLHVDVVVDLLLVDQLDLRVVLRNLVETQQVQQVQPNHGVLLLGGGDHAIELIVVRAENANVALEVRDVLALNRQESCVFVNFACEDALFGVAHLAGGDVLKLGNVDHQFLHGVVARGERVRLLLDLLESLQVVHDALNGR